MEELGKNIKKENDGNIENKNEINNLWKYVSENAVNIDWTQLHKDIEIIKKCPNIEDVTEQYGISTSGMIYREIFLLFKKINKELSFEIGMKMIPLVDPEIIDKIKFKHQKEKAENGENIENVEIDPNDKKYRRALCRYEIIISANGNYLNFPLVKQICEISKEYTLLDDLLVVKYYPPDIFPVLRVLFKNILLGPSVMKYRLQNISQTQEIKLDLVIAVDDKIIQQHIKTEGDISGLRNGVFLMLENILGEYV